MKLKIENNLLTFNNKTYKLNSKKIFGGFLDDSFNSKLKIEAKDSTGDEKLRQLVDLLKKGGSIK